MFHPQKAWSAEDRIKKGGLINKNNLSTIGNP
jgi:hypothetical protein